YNGASSASSCDLDGDGDLDILASANIAGDVAWWANDANLVSGNIGFSNKYSVSDSYDGAVFVGSIDLDRDGDYDILGNGRLADDVTWWESDSTPSDGGWTIHAIDSNFDGSYAAAFADLDIDGDIDVVAAAYNADEIAWYENNGSETFTKRSVATDFNGANSVFIIDLDGDGDLDIAATAGIDDDLTWWANDSTPSDGGWTMSTIDGDLNGANSVFCVDVDKDGDIDILATADVGDDVAWWENNGSESFTKRKIEDSFNGAASISAVDLDADGDMDVLACASNSNKLTWWASDGTPADGGWTEYTIDENVTDASILHPVDLDRDGDTDILAAEKSGDEVLWMENDGTPLDGGWIKHRIDTGFDGASSLFPIDLDRDGDIDLLGAAGEGDDITWWENGGASAAGDSVATEAGATANINVDFTTLTAPSHQMSLGQSAESNVGDTTTEEAEQEIDVRCFIATAAFGTPQSYEVMRLRRFRDRYLAATPAGRGIIKAYYTVSPPVADIISKNWVLKNLVRFILKSILCIIN
ncbi:MAG: VCBS repeat-containing protein, partial [Candidatus Omnitrophica bacterium]|nr:VCBS repeat-containing protein [Candidatus Omnitrophota bacterium]